VDNVESNSSLLYGSVVQPVLDRLIYVDDSGRPQAGLAVYGWIEFAPHTWASVLETWLALRKRLWREFAIPVHRELHTGHYVNGRGRLADRVPPRHVHDGVEFWKDFGREVAVACLDTVRCIEGLRVGAVHRSGPPGSFALTRTSSYAALLEAFEEDLRNSRSLGLVFIDGDGTDKAFRTAHRGLVLSERHVIEDAVHLDSSASHLMQMADLVAWCANAAVDPSAGNEFAHDWYRRFLSEREPAREPLRI
jgi:hypothetical protein